jgi:hypothetical protein
LYRGLPIFVLLLAACLPYLNSLENSFHFDDVPEIVQNESVHSLHGLLGARPIGRWLTYATYYVNYSFDGLTSMVGWHVVNILLHAACVLALYSALGDLFAAAQSGQPAGTAKRWDSAPFLGALLFGIHPLASEPVNYIEARCVLMYTLFTLLALRCAIRAHRADSPSRKVGFGIAVLGLVLLASVSKPVGLFFSLALPSLYFLTFVVPESSYKRRAILWGGATGAVLIYAAAVWLIHTDAWIQERLTADLRYYFCGQIIVFWRYVALLICPLPSCLNVDHAIAYRQYSLTDTDVFVSAAALVVAVLMPAAYLIRGRPVVSFLLLAIPLGMLPYFVLTSAEAMVEYRCYLPLAAFCGLAGMSANLLLNRTKTTGRMILAALVIVLAVATVMRNEIWRTDLSLWSDAASKSPRKARTINGLAWALLTDKLHGNPHYGLELAKRSLDRRYVDLPPGFNPYMVDTLAEAYFVNGDVATAVQIERKIIAEGLGDLNYFQQQLNRYVAAQHTLPPHPSSPTR